MALDRLYGLSCPRCCGARSVRACPRAACSPWPPVRSWNASASVWRSCAPYWDVTATLEAPGRRRQQCCVWILAWLCRLAAVVWPVPKDFGDDGLADRRRRQTKPQLDETARECDRAIAGICDVHRRVDGNQAVPSPSGAAVHHVHAAADAAIAFGMSSRQTMRAAQGCTKTVYHVYAYRFGDAVAGGDRGRP